MTRPVIGLIMVPSGRWIVFIGLWGVFLDPSEPWLAACQVELIMLWLSASAVESSPGSSRAMRSLGAGCHILNEAATAPLLASSLTPPGRRGAGVPPDRAWDGGTGCSPGLTSPCCSSARSSFPLASSVSMVAGWPGNACVITAALCQAMLDAGRSVVRRQPLERTASPPPQPPAHSTSARTADSGRLDVISTFAVLPPSKQHPVGEVVARASPPRAPAVRHPHSAAPVFQRRNCRYL